MLSANTTVRARLPAVACKQHRAARLACRAEDEPKVVEDAKNLAKDAVEDSSANGRTPMKEDLSNVTHPGTDFVCDALQCTFWRAGRCLSMECARALESARRLAATLEGRCCSMAACRDFQTFFDFVSYMLLQPCALCGAIDRG